MNASIEALEAAWRNPFDSDAARSHSAYHGVCDGEPVRLLEAAPAHPFARVAHDAFRAFVFDDAFSCLGAKSALRRQTYRFGGYDSLEDPAVAEGLARDLFAFTRERRSFRSDFTTYVATFRDSIGVEGDTHDAEIGFERALWTLLQRLHDLDADIHAWDPEVSDDPSDPQFSFSFAGTGFFVVGLHPKSSRASRRFAWPTLVFNAHEQFENLRAAGRFVALRDRIRHRERQLDGDTNPNLSDYGTQTEARQYSGRHVEARWECPFKAHR